MHVVKATLMPLLEFAEPGQASAPLLNLLLQVKPFLTVLLKDGDLPCLGKLDWACLCQLLRNEERGLAVRLPCPAPHKTLKSGKQWGPLQTGHRESWPCGHSWGSDLLC